MQKTQKITIFQNSENHFGEGQGANAPPATLQMTSLGTPLSLPLRQPPPRQAIDVSTTTLYAKHYPRPVIDVNKTWYTPVYAKHHPHRLLM